MSEGPDVYSERRPRARQPHRCCECGGRVEPGEPYLRFTGVWDGEWRTYKRCDDCDQLADRIDEGRDTHDDPVPFGHLSEHVFDGENLEDVRAFVATLGKRGMSVGTDWLALVVALERRTR